jgi:hypothetical protein
VVICFAFLSFGNEYVVGVNGRLCVLMHKMVCLEFWTFHIDVDVIRVYVVLC